MDKVNRILVPLDGSPEAEVGLGAVMPLVRAYSPEVLLLTVLDRPDVPSLARSYLEKSCKALRSKNVNAVPGLRQGKLAQEILDYAREKEADLISMSTHGRSGLRRALMGSVTEEVLRHAEVPLLASRPGHSVRDWSRIVVALDGSRPAEGILPDALALARTVKGALDLVRVALPVIVPGGIGEVPVSFPAEDPMPYLRRLCGDLAAGGVPVNPVALEGSAAPEIARYATEIGAGLICMTTQGATGLARFILGSVAEQVLRTAPCPVLVRRAVAVPEPARR